MLHWRRISRVAGQQLKGTFGATSFPGGQWTANPRTLFDKQQRGTGGRGALETPGMFSTLEQPNHTYSEQEE